MKKLVLFFALVALGAVGANAQTVVLDAGNPENVNIATVAGETYTVTPVSGAWSEFGSVSGCDAGGANCDFGFVFTYSIVSGFSVTTVETVKFDTAALAFAGSLGTSFVAAATSPAVFFLPCVCDSGATGVITLDVALFNAAVSQSLGPDSVFSTADALLSVPDFSPCGDGGCELAGPDAFGFDQFSSVFAACDGGGCDSLFDIAFDCTGSSCMESDMAQNEFSYSWDVADALEPTLPVSDLEAEDGSSTDQGQEEAPAQNKLLNPDKVLKSYEFEYASDNITANMASLETARVIALARSSTAAGANMAPVQTARVLGDIMGEDDIVYLTLFKAIIPAELKLTDKIKEFRRTKTGAALFAASQWNGQPTKEYLAAEAAYTSVEIKAAWIAKVDLGIYNLYARRNIYNLYVRRYKVQNPSDQAEDSGSLANQDYDGTIKALNAAVEAAKYKYYNKTYSSVWSWSTSVEFLDLNAAINARNSFLQRNATAIQPALDAGMAIQPALDAQNQADMELKGSVVKELAPITVISQAGPVKTYAAADGPATIVTAFADTRK